MRPDPFASEKPRLVITGRNADEYKPQLTAVAYALLKRYPSMRLDVYPTHRPVTFPPKINANISRDHWPQCYTALLAGGGVKRGFIYGASDKNGAYPDRDGVRPDDLAATMFHLLGIDPATEVHDALNRPLPIAAGKPIYGLMA